MRPNPRLQRTPSASPPPPSRQPLYLRLLGSIANAGLALAAASLFAYPTAKATALDKQATSTTNRSVQVVATIQDRDDRTRLVLNSSVGGEKKFAEGANRLLALRVEWASEDIGDPEIVVVEPEDGGVGCGEHRTEEVAAERERYYDLRVGDRLFTTMQLIDDPVCGRLRSCDSSLSQTWLITGWWTIGKGAVKK